MKKEEVNYKVHFVEKYFNKKLCDYDVLNQVDLLIKDKKNNPLLYIESKDSIFNENDLNKALAQIILTNHKQENILSKVALIYRDKEKNDVLKLIDCSDDSIMYNNDINWKQEKPSNPTKDAIDRINDRIFNKITTYYNEEIKEFYNLLLTNQNIKLNITVNNINVVYNEWKNNVKFTREIENEQDLINLFLVDILDGTKYKNVVKNELLGNIEQTLIREGTDLNKYLIIRNNNEVYGISYDNRELYVISDAKKYNLFWNKYKRPPEQEEFLQILERSAKLYSDKYRRTTGAEYTPCCFVELQNKILEEKGYDLNEFIVFDPCCGVGNLQNQFGKEFKQYCYLSTLEEKDVDICKIKGFENTIKYDYLKDDKQPKFKYQGNLLGINEICKRENRKLMVIMNPPYQRIKGFQNDLAIEFFNKVIKLEPQVIVYYFKTEAILREIDNFINSKYKIVSHVMSNAKTTFLLSEWPISQVIFDKSEGEEIIKSSIKVNRYEYSDKSDKLKYIKTYSYNQEKSNLIKEIEKEIKKNQSGLVLGQWCYLTGVLVVSNGGKEKSNKITTNNLKYCLLSKGINFNTHNKYFEESSYCYKGKFEDITEELLSDSVMFSLFYKGNLFSNKEVKNYIIPFTNEMLGCNKNDLNVLIKFEEKTDVNRQQDLFDNTENIFDFREWLKQFNFSQEAKDLYKSTLQIFLYYHKNYKNTNYNDSFFDITNTIMNKNPDSYVKMKNDTRVTVKRKTTKGTIGFGKNTIKNVVSSEYLPIFYDFFDKRDILAKKINKQLVESGLLLWERENIY